MSGRIKVHLVCSICSARNYETTRRPDQVGPIERKKYCPTCNTHTLHKESK